MFATPILFIIFKRLDTAKQVFTVIRQIQPSMLFISADGPRQMVDGEKERCKKVRDYVLNSIDWNCEVKTLFRDENLGCGKAVSGAITWFFEQVEQGIILEDDCVPSLSFFPYCEELLARYKDTDNIYHISGYNPLGCIKNLYSYYFARIQHCWGWASWRLAWKQYRFDIKGLDAFIAGKNIDKIFKRKCDRQYWLHIFKEMEQHKIDTWDYQWTYTIFQNNGVCINPSENLISNIGFDGDATHTTGSASKFNNQKRYEITDIKHPEKISINNSIINKINRDTFGIENGFIGMYKRNRQRIVKLYKLIWRS
jgi:hypothetical protein